MILSPSGAVIMAVTLLTMGSLTTRAAFARPQPPTGSSDAMAPGLPELPPGAVRLVSHRWHGATLALCVQEPGPPIEHQGNWIPRTRVWVHDGTASRQLGMGAGACDPAWSPDGGRLAVVGPDGLWVVTRDLRTTIHLVDTRRGRRGGAAGPRTLASPQWSPDGSRVALTVTSESGTAIEVVNAGTGEVVFTGETGGGEFAWGADSRSLRLGPTVVPVP